MLKYDFFGFPVSILNANIFKNQQSTNNYNTIHWKILSLLAHQQLVLQCQVKISLSSFVFCLLFDSMKYARDLLLGLFLAQVLFALFCQLRKLNYESQTSLFCLYFLQAKLFPYQRETFLSLVRNVRNKLGRSCAKLRPAWASYQLAFVWLAFTEAY